MLMIETTKSNPHRNYVIALKANNTAFNNLFSLSKAVSQIVPTHLNQSFWATIKYLMLPFTVLIPYLR